MKQTLFIRARGTIFIVLCDMIALHLWLTDFYGKKDLTQAVRDL